MSYSFDRDGCLMIFACEWSDMTNPFDKMKIDLIFDKDVSVDKIFCFENILHKY
jgi:hypothetical protein